MPTDKERRQGGGLKANKEHFAEEKRECGWVFRSEGIGALDRPGGGRGRKKGAKQEKSKFWQILNLILCPSKTHI